MDYTQKMYLYRDRVLCEVARMVFGRSSSTLFVKLTTRLGKSPCVTLSNYFSSLVYALADMPNVTPQIIARFMSKFYRLLEAYGSAHGDGSECPPSHTTKVVKPIVVENLTTRPRIRSDGIQAIREHLESVIPPEQNNETLEPAFKENLPCNEKSSENIDKDCAELESFDVCGIAELALPNGFLADELESSSTSQLSGEKDKVSDYLTCGSQVGATGVNNVENLESQNCDETKVEPNGAIRKKKRTRKSADISTTSSYVRSMPIVQAPKSTDRIKRAKAIQNPSLDEDNYGDRLRKACVLASKHLPDPHDVQVVSCVITTLRKNKQLFDSFKVCYEEQGFGNLTFGVKDLHRAWVKYGAFFQSAANLVSSDVKMCD